MSKKIKLVVDQIDQQNNQVKISGWACNLLTKEPVEVTLLNAEKLDHVEIKAVKRQDVNQHFDLTAELKVGFELSFSAQPVPKEVQLVLRSGSIKETKELKLKLTTQNPSLLQTSKRLVQVLRKGTNYLQKHGVKATVRKLKLERKRRNQTLYHEWIMQNETIQIEEIQKEIAAFSYQPLLSIVMPVYNVEEKWLRKCIDSCLAQFYPNWELCIADDASTDPRVREVLTEYEKKDERIHVVYRQENGHISEATNSALAIAKGEFIVLLDNDDELAQTALFEVVKQLNRTPDCDLIYSDEDKMDEAGRRSDPAFKPDFSPDLLLGTNYISHLGVYRKAMIDKIGGFRKGYEGSQDYDLVLRFTEQTTSDKVKHIPKILYHWRILPTSTAGDQSSKQYAFDAGLKALQSAIERRGLFAEATHGAANGLYDINYKVQSEELVSIIIPTKDGWQNLKRCLASLRNKTSYKDYEIIIVDNGSSDPRMKELYAEYQEQMGERFCVLSLPIAFNFATLNNEAVKIAQGKYVLLLNDDIEVIQADWLENMVSFAQQERIGCVGAKLLYPNNTIQHAGIVLGLGGAAGHPFYEYPKDDLGYFGRLALNVNYSAVTAACLMVKKADYLQVGGMSEEFAVAFNDVDFCLKIQQLGRNNVYLHQVALYHYESQTRGYETTPEKQQRFEAEAALLEKRWGDWIQNDPYYNPNLTRKASDFSLRF